jgi:hypothetical protein
MRCGVVVARDPNPFKLFDQLAQSLAVMALECPCALVAVKTVAQRKHAPRTRDRDIALKPPKRHRGIIGR